MIYGNMREAMTLKYRKDDIFISLTEGETSHVGGGIREHVHKRKNVPGEIFILHREFK